MRRWVEERTESLQLPASSKWGRYSETLLCRWYGVSRNLSL